MPIERSDLKRLIFQALVKGVQRNGERIFDVSQSTELCFVPVDTGMLKHSGYTRMLTNGIELGYTAPYSRDVESGHEARPITGTQIVHVRTYKRKDGRVVPAHDVRYVNKRLIGFKPKLSKFERGPLIFRVLSEEPAQEGQRYLGRAILVGIQKLADDMDVELQRLETM